ncbi:MAG: hypothetical protein FD149_2270 [Rhodospirillaceae bacterium]|nr:MAG: hypothetical protein FD149_2270 [Rhodospirillaceae bacterium]
MPQQRRHPMDWNHDSRRAHLFRHFHANLCPVPQYRHGKAAENIT